MGTVLEGDGVARIYANRIIGELKEAGGYDDPGLAMTVRNESGKAVFIVPFYAACSVQSG